MDFDQLKRPYLIAEVGINHNGDMQMAKKLIDATFACSWDCVKFQKRNPDVCVPEKQKNIERNTPWGVMTYLEYKYRMEFGKKEYDFIDTYCQQKPLNWTMSVWDVDSIHFAKQYDLPFIKIPSAHLANEELIKEACATKLPVILSTGMSTIDEVDTAVDLMRASDTQFVLMHCNSSYPAKMDELNLRLIPFLKERYDCVVGYSGHEFGLEPTVLAVAMGAMVIERHITLDHSLWGTDQASSVEIQGMDKLNKRINAVHDTLGDGKKYVYESERTVRAKLRGY